MGTPENVAVTATRAEFWETESCQTQGNVWSRAQDVDTRHGQQHPHQRPLTFHMRAANEEENVV